MTACPSEAISIVGKKMSVTQVVKEIERDLAFYEESGGGVTFSGGEPLLQVEFLNKLLDSCNMRGIHATLDTSGYVTPEIMDSIRSKVDLFLYDIKIIDDRKHRKYTGASNKVILHNLEELTKGGSNVAVRLPVIPRINDDEANITDTGKLISSLHYVKNVTLLSYHRTGLDKYQSLGRSYKLTAIQPPTTQKLKIIKKNLESFGLVVKIGGR